MAWESEHIISQFPILRRDVHGHPLVYLDNAATTQKPSVVIEAIVDYYEHHNANVHRGVHTLGDESTRIFHNSRQAIADFFGADEVELVLTRNTTEGINLLATGLADRLSEGDAVLVTKLEHHSNFVPWQRLSRERGAEFIVAPLLPDGRVDEDQLLALIDRLGERLRVLALTHISNATGAVLNVDKIVEYVDKKAWRENLVVVVDAAQSAARLPIDFHYLGADALAFSGHKMYGPMGIGGVLVKKKLLSKMEPVLLGGGMIGRVGLEQTTYADDLSDRFTAGTPDVASAAGLAAACKFLQQIGLKNIAQHDQQLTQYAYQKLSSLPEIEIVGPTPEDGRMGSIAFLYQDSSDGSVNQIHAHDVAQVLDRHGIAVRSGHHCTMPLHEHFDWTATTRASWGIYNTESDIDRLAEALPHVKKILSRHE